jgi:hypothetical protein
MGGTSDQLSSRGRPRDSGRICRMSPTKKATESGPHRTGSLAAWARIDSLPLRGMTQRSSGRLQGTTRAKTGSPTRTARLDSAAACSSTGSWTGAGRPGGAVIRYHALPARTMSALPSRLHANCSGAAAPFGSRSSRSAPFTRFMTQSDAGVESRSDRPRRNATWLPSGESAGLSSATVVKVMGMAGPPSARTAYRSPFGPRPPTNTANDSRPTSIFPRSGGIVPQAKATHRVSRMDQAPGIATDETRRVGRLGMLQIMSRSDRRTAYRSPLTFALSSHQPFGSTTIFLGLCAIPSTTIRLSRPSTSIRTGVPSTTSMRWGRRYTPHSAG